MSTVLIPLLLAAACGVGLGSAQGRLGSGFGAVQLVSLCLSVSLSLSTSHESGGPSNRGTGPNLPRGSRHPDVVVFGVGDSGTRAFTDYLSGAGGVHMCDGGGPRKGSRNPKTLDCTPTQECQLGPSSPLTQGQASRPVQLSRAAYMTASSEAFRDTVQCERLQSEKVFRKIQRKFQNETEDCCFWGYKNPRHTYLLPVIREAFGDDTGMILVARHPYDVCSGKNQAQYNHFGHWFGNNGTEMPSCMEFWFQVMSQVLHTIEAHPRTMRIVRIETLVLDAQWRKERAGRCIGDLLGYDYSPRRDREATAAMAGHGGSYGGRSRVGGDAKKTRLFEEAKRDTSAKMERLAATLGYNMSAYAAWGTVDELLPTPTSAAVC